MDTPRRRLTRTESREQTRAALLESAQRVFLKLGYSRATLDVIAADAGYTKGAIYWSWASKEALFLELLQKLLQVNIDHLDRLVTDTKDDPDRLTEEMGYWIDLVDERDDLPLLLLELELESRRKPDLAPTFDAVISSHETDLANIQRRMFAILGREPPVPFEQLAPSVIMLAEGFALARQTRKGSYFASATIRALLGLPPRRIHTRRDPSREWWAKGDGKQ